MSTIKSSAENLTLNADGSGNDVLVQSNGSTKAIVTAEGSVGIGTTTPAQKLSLNTGYVQVGNGIGGGGGVKYPYSAANADCRNWRTRSDMQEYGDWGIEQSTTQSGETYSHKFKITQAGDAVVNTGDLIFGTANKGIVLGATTNVAANTLDDYEEGTFTVGNFTGTVNSGTLTWRGTYVKIGSLVTFNIVQLTGNITWAVYQVITGLPFDIEADQYTCAVYTNEDPTIFGGMLAWHTNQTLYFQAAAQNQIHICISGSYHTND